MSTHAHVAGFLAIGFFLGIASVCFGQRASGEPNVIFILADDMGYGDLSAINEGMSRTPNLDALMKESRVFSQAYSAAPVCAPARAGLLTGRYPHRTGVVGLNSNRGVTEMHRDEVTIGNVFQDSGYVTGLIGKWHVGLADHNHPTRRGFDSFEGFRGGFDIPSYDFFRLELYGDHIEWDGPRGFRNTSLTDELNRRAIQFVQRHQNQPFFLHLAHYAPHRPLDAPEEKIWPYLAAGFHRDTATVYAMLEIMDEGIGRLLAEVDALGLAEKTIVVFSSDNGPDPMVHERFNSGLSGSKYYVDEGGIRVPFFIRWPGVLEPGVTDQPLHFVDLLPTLAAACNVAVPAGLELDGIDLWEWLTGAGHVEMPKRFWQWTRPDPEYTHNAAMRDGDWKLLKPYGNPASPPWGFHTNITAPSRKEPRLFNLREDPEERENLAKKYPERVRQMTQELAAWAEAVERTRRQGMEE